MRVRDGERLTEAARTGAEQPHRLETASVSHLIEPVGRLEGANQDGAGAPFLLANEVETPMDPVRPIDVRVPRRCEHTRVPSCPSPAETVAGRILLVVSLGLHDHAADAVHEQRRPDELWGDFVDAPREEALS